MDQAAVLWKQVVVLQAQIVAMDRRAAPRPNTKSSVEVAKLQIFNREIGKVSGFLMVCRPYIQMKMSGTLVEEQIQWLLLYIQGESVGI